MKQPYGGEWTEIKLQCLRKYLNAYTQVMKNQPFKIFYLDAFAGTGYRNLKYNDDKTFLFPDIIDNEAQNFLDGSVKIALNTEPRFHKYIFIELDKNKCNELEKIKNEYSKLKNDIIIVNGEANKYIEEFCNKIDKKSNRAVLFLDPFGMQVKWKTIESIALTKIIDLWLLFPLGIGINRLLKKNGEISTIYQYKLDNIFGTHDWFKEFYQDTERNFIFGNNSEFDKIVDFDKIKDFFIKRLKSIFEGVASNPLKLCNSKNNPLFLLCFAASNPKGSKIAIKIAEDILLKGMK